MVDGAADGYCETRAECVANALTHGVGLVFAVGAAATLVAGAAAQGDALRVATLGVFGAALIGVYLSSLLFHAARRPERQRVLQKIDHIAIYLLIAGTYTPLMLVTFGDAWGWGLFAAVWTLAAGGTVFKLSSRECATRGWGQCASTGLYLVMGWLIVIAWERLLAATSAEGLAWLAGGGIAYTAGVGFYLWRRLKFNHAVWHCFVMAGSACHVMAMWEEVVRR